MEHLLEEDVLLLAAGLAFYGLVSVAPLVVLGCWLTSLVLGDEQVRQTGEGLARLTPGKMGVDKVFVRVAETGSGLGLWALAGAVWPATAYGAGLVRAFDRLSHDPRPLPGLRGRALAVMLIAALPAVVLAALALGMVGPRLLGEGLLLAVLGWALGLGLGFLTLAVMSGLIYRLFTPDDVGWRDVARGAVLAAGTVSVVSLGYVLFLRLGTNFEQRYAASGLAAVVLLGVWLFLANALLLVGYRVMHEPRE